jgi:hypothetical protein
MVDNFTAICEPILYTLWDPRYLTTLYASTACYRDSFIYLFFCITWIVVYFNSGSGGSTRGSIVVEVLCYKPEDRGFDCR